jgi:hypothetical protein
MAWRALSNSGRLTLNMRCLEARLIAITLENTRTIGPKTIALRFSQGGCLHSFDLLLPQISSLQRFSLAVTTLTPQKR